MRVNLISALVLLLGPCGYYAVPQLQRRLRLPHRTVPVLSRLPSRSPPLPPTSVVALSLPARTHSTPPLGSAPLSSSDLAPPPAQPAPPSSRPLPPPASQPKPQQDSAPAAGPGSCTLLVSLLTESKPIKPSQVAACFQSFPYNKTLAEQTIASVNSLLGMYVFLDYRRSFNEWPLAPFRDPTFSPAKYKEPTFKADFEFQEALADYFAGWCDGHLEYRPTCYRTFMFVQPLYVTPVADSNGTSRFVIYGVDNTASPELKKYVGYEIVAINGKLPIDVLGEYAATSYGKFRSGRTRLTRSAATRYYDSQAGTFKIDRGFFFKRSKVPTEDAIVYKVRHPDSDKTESVTIPWQVGFMGDKPFKDAQDYWNVYCHSSVRGTPNKVAIPPVNSVDAMSGVDDSTLVTAAQATNAGDALQDKGGPSALDYGKPVYKGPGFGFFKVSGVLKARISNQQQIDYPTGNVGVLVVETFSPGVSQDEWDAKLREGLKALMAQNVTRLILDLSNNPGGVICLAQAMIRLFYPQADFYRGAKQELSEEAKRELQQRRMWYGNQISSGNVYTTGVRNSTLLLKLAQAFKAAKQSSPFLPQAYIDPDTMKPYDAKKSWNDLGVRTSSRNGGKECNQLGPLVDYCPPPKAETPLNHPYTGNNLLVMTNGACGSSCAIVAAFLQESAKVKSVGILNAALSITSVPMLVSYAGGQVLKSSYMFQQLAKANITEPRPFPTTAEFTFTYRLLYNLAQGLPLEFTHLSPSGAVFNLPKNVLRPKQQWEAAAETVGWFDAETKGFMCRAVRKATEDVHLWQKQLNDPKIGHLVKESLQDSLAEFDWTSLEKGQQVCSEGQIRLGNSLPETLQESNRLYQRDL